MKKERFSFFILFVEIAAIVLLHSAKSRQMTGHKMLGERKSIASAPYQFKTLTVTKIK